MIEMLFWLGIFIIALWLECLLGPFGDQGEEDRFYRSQRAREYRRYRFWR